MVLEADFVYGGGGDMTGEVLEEIWWWWGEDSSATYTANSLIFLPPFLCGYHVQRSDNSIVLHCSSSVYSTTTFHTLCVSKRIQTYNTLGIHLQSVKISGTASPA